MILYTIAGHIQSRALFVPDEAVEFNKIHLIGFFNVFGKVSGCFRYDEEKLFDRLVHKDGDFLSVFIEKLDIDITAQPSAADKNGFMNIGPVKDTVVFPLFDQKSGELLFTMMIRLNTVDKPVFPSVGKMSFVLCADKGSFFDLGFCFIDQVIARGNYEFA